MIFAKGSGSVAGPYSSSKITDPFSGMQFDSLGKASFFKLLEVLKRRSDMAEQQNQTSDVDQLNVEGQGDSQPSSGVDVPPPLQWGQIRELRQNIVNAVQQAVRSWADTDPEQARDAVFCSRGIAQKNQISDVEAVELIQAVEQTLVKQETVRCIEDEHIYSAIVLQHKQRSNALEETNNQNTLASSFDQPGSNEPQDPKRNDDTPEVDLAKNTDLTQAEWAIAVVAETVQVNGPVASGLPTSEFSAQPPGFANDPNNWPPHPEQSSSDPRQRVAKVYSEVENPAELVRELRERYHLSQESFARKIKVAFATVNRWENGHATPRPIAIKSLKQLTKALGAEGEDLLEKHFPAAYQKRQKKILQASRR